MTKQSEFSVSEEDFSQYKRLDAYLAAKIKDQSRSNIKKLFESGHFQASIKIELKRMPPPGTSITYTHPELKDIGLVAQNIPLDIIYEDEHLIIINKQAGLVIHPAPGNPDGTLVNAVLFHCPDLKGIGNEKRPGIVHRLDKGTTGVMVVAKTQACHEGLVELFSKHDIMRKYQAIALGNKLSSHISIDAAIGRSPYNRLKMATKVKNSKKAITHVKTLSLFKNFSLLEMTLETGRTHQIRVHLSEILNSPILNDQTYGRTKEEKLVLPSQAKSLIKDYEHPFLHAKLLGFIHPITKEELVFEAPPPKLFLDVLDILKNHN